MLWRHRPTLVGALVLAAATAQAQPDPETIIRGGDVFVEGGVRAADVRIVGAVITEVGSALEPRDATTRIVDADGLLVLPGGIDPHVHLGVARADDYDSGSRAALAGGITTISNFGGVREGETPAQALQRARPDIEAQSIADVIFHPIVSDPASASADTLEALETAVDAALTHDVLVFSGGSSVGERDLTLDVLERKGEVLFHGIAVKPGKPTAFGRIGDTPVLGMPGYPTSCLSNAYMLLVPLLRAMAHLPPHRMRTVTIPAAQRLVSTTGRHQFYTVRIVNGEAVGAFKASGDITSMSQADGYIEVPAQTDIVDKGELVEVKLF